MLLAIHTTLECGLLLLWGDDHQLNGTFQIPAFSGKAAVRVQMLSTHTPITPLCLRLRPIRELEERRHIWKTSLQDLGFRASHSAKGFIFRHAMSAVLRNYIN